LYPEPVTVDGEPDKVKAKLRRNPSQLTSVVYEENIYPMDWSYDHVGYSHFRAMLDKYKKQTLLNNIIECVGTVSLLFSGTTLLNWQNVMDKLPVGHIWTKETFDHALTAFVLKYCSNTARQEQKWFMQSHIGLPHHQLTTSLFS
jgi:hypothetical protein